MTPDPLREAAQAWAAAKDRLAEAAEREDEGAWKMAGGDLSRAEAALRATLAAPLVPDDMGHGCSPECSSCRAARVLAEEVQRQREWDAEHPHIVEKYGLAPAEKPENCGCYSMACPKHEYIRVDRDGTEDALEDAAQRGFRLGYEAGREAAQPAPAAPLDRERLARALIEATRSLGTRSLPGPKHGHGWPAYSEWRNGEQTTVDLVVSELSDAIADRYDAGEP